MTIWNGLFFGDGKEYQRCFLFLFFQPAFLYFRRKEVREMLQLESAKCYRK
jgi:hypothetical protein